MFDLSADETARTLSALVDHSLLMEPKPRRYRFHDLMRLYAREVAGRDEPDQSRHEAGRGLMLRCKSTALSEIGRFEDAIETSELSLDNARRQGDRLEEAKLLSNVTTTYHRARRYEDAVVHGQQALDLFEALGEEVLGIVPRINMTASLNLLRRTDEAIVILTKAVELSRRSGNRVYLGSSLAQLGVCQLSRENADFGDAESTLLEALEVVRSTGNRHHEAVVLGQLGLLCDRTGRPVEALEYLRASRRLFTDLGAEFENVYQAFTEAVERLEKAELAENAEPAESDVAAGSAA